MAEITMMERCERSACIVCRQGKIPFPVSRTAVEVESILPCQTVEAIINKFDDIAVGNCFGRQRPSLLAEPCRSLAPVGHCFSFGKSAWQTSAQGFTRKVSRAEALTMLKDVQQAGLVHKAFHPGDRKDRPGTSICNCCKDCGDTFRLWREGTLPLINSTFHLAVIEADVGTGCGSCVNWCPTDAIRLDEDELALRDEDACLGCGVCARFCRQR